MDMEAWFAMWEAHDLEGVECQWFAMCANPAVRYRPHPAFVDGVPICHRCDHKAEQIAAESRDEYNERS